MSMIDRLNRVMYGANHSAIREFSNLASKTPGCIALTLGEPDADTNPAITAEVAKAFENHETHYIMNNGTPELRAKIAAFENKRNGHRFTADNVIVTDGAEEALFVALFGILEPGDEVIIPTPAFVVYEEITKLCRCRPVLMDTADDGFQIRKDRLESLVNERTKAIVLNSPNNPTGTVLNRESLQAIHDVILGKDIFVVADDVYNRLVYTEDCHSIMEYEDLKDQRILVQSFSKPYAMTGWRMGYLCVSAELRERLELLHQFIVTSTPAPFQRAAVKALDTDITDYLANYRRRRAYMIGRLDKIGLDYPRPDGAFYVFPSIAKFGMSSSEFCTRMIEEAGLAATPGFAFGRDDHIRLTYCYSDEVLREGLGRLENFVRKLESEGRND